MLGSLPQACATEAPRGRSAGCKTPLPHRSPLHTHLPQRLTGHSCCLTKRRTGQPESCQQPARMCTCAASTAKKELSAAGRCMSSTSTTHCGNIFYGLLNGSGLTGSSCFSFFTAPRSWRSGTRGIPTLRSISSRKSVTQFLHRYLPWSASSKL
jgi:hypothetical protein